MRKLTHDEFIQRMDNKNSSIKILGQYDGGQKDIECECLICGYHFMRSGANLLYQNFGCPQCTRLEKVKKLTNTHESFIERMNDINKDIVIKSEYKYAKQKVKCLCKACGHEWDATPSKLLYGRGCPECARVNRGLKSRMNPDDFRNRLLETRPDIGLLSEYTTSSDYVVVECKVCGHTYQSLPFNLLHGRRCPNCTNIKKGLMSRGNHDDFVNKMKGINNSITILSKYITNTTKLHCLCNECGEKFDSTPAQLLRGQGCPICNNTSKGEIRIKSFLELSNIPFVMHYSFDELRGLGGKPLSYDFYLPDYNVLIEYQGQQHYKPISVFGGDEAFSIQIEHDKRKFEYAQNNDYQLIVIGYKDFCRINDILSKILLLQRKEAV